ncbi:bifunctional diguanylate cyclase/phosphodiesterase [Paenibacillus alginolyticus]|uniref:putative bifunctional diguanylate cyclase/phosphodiesterase n=1 Tax=Paenibacillus alginolyticus TaxID=59839 RepID=UPI0003FCF389|nr:bifunctional diguanylate cyclase/phosphodiesterase [Paenibacillus alginolyticus]MCY9668854.1 bifunctional diguanylate cyclase/phosphodiesterase [Paenibacillus alginolyticus]
MKAVRRLFHFAASTILGTLRSKKIITRIHQRQQLQALLKQAIGSQHHAKDTALLRTLLILDIDRFRQVNFSLGYKSGDLLLEEVGNRLRAIHGCGLVIQSGDDEFVLLIHASTQDQLSQAIQSIQHVFATSFIVMGQECFITVSIGMSAVDITLTTIEQALHQADQALLAAKRTGKNKLVTYHSSHAQPFSNQIQMETELRKAILENQLILYYQPRLELSTGNIICLEALVRWNHPEIGLIAPNEFIPLAEESGLILQLGEWVLREACLQKARWLEADILNYQIAVNISPCQFQDESFSDKAIQIIEQTGIDPAFLEFEITESSIMQNMDTTVAVLDKLCNKGISISIDDFGIGYSSLNYLKHFPIHCLKIDRSFVKNIHSNKDDWAITNAIIHLGHALEVQVVAEGVEEWSQLEILKETTCTTIQGYLLSPPVSAIEIEQTFQANNNIPVMIS